MTIYSELANWDGSVDRHRRRPQSTPPYPLPIPPPSSPATGTPAAPPSHSPRSATSNPHRLASNTCAASAMSRPPPPSSTSSRCSLPLSDSQDSSDTAMLLSTSPPRKRFPEAHADAELMDAPRMHESEVPRKTLAERIMHPHESPHAVQNSHHSRVGPDLAMRQQLIRSPPREGRRSSMNLAARLAIPASLYARSMSQPGANQTIVQQHPPASKVSSHEIAQLGASPKKSETSSAISCPSRSADALPLQPTLPPLSARTNDPIVSLGAADAFVMQKLNEASSNLHDVLRTVSVRKAGESSTTLQTAASADAQSDAMEDDLDGEGIDDPDYVQNVHLGPNHVPATHASANLITPQQSALQPEQDTPSSDCTDMQMSDSDAETPAYGEAEAVAFINAVVQGLIPAQMQLSSPEPTRGRNGVKSSAGTNLVQAANEKITATASIDVRPEQSSVGGTASDMAITPKASLSPLRPDTPYFTEDRVAPTNNVMPGAESGMEVLMEASRPLPCPSRPRAVTDAPAVSPLGSNMPEPPSAASKQSSSSLVAADVPSVPLSDSNVPDLLAVVGPQQDSPMGLDVPALPLVDIELHEQQSADSPRSPSMPTVTENNAPVAASRETSPMDGHMLLQFWDLLRASDASRAHDAVDTAHGTNTLNSEATFIDANEVAPGVPVEESSDLKRSLADGGVVKNDAPVIAGQTSPRHDIATATSSSPQLPPQADPPIEGSSSSNNAAVSTNDLPDQVHLMTAEPMDIPFISGVQRQVSITPTRVSSPSASTLTDLESSPEVRKKTSPRPTRRLNRAYVLVPPLPRNIPKDSYKSTSEFDFLHSAPIPATMRTSASASPSASASAPKRKRGRPSSAQAQRKKPRLESMLAGSAVDIVSMYIPCQVIDLEDTPDMTLHGMLTALRHVRDGVRMALDKMVLHQHAELSLREANNDVFGAFAQFMSLHDIDESGGASSVMPTPGITPDTANASSPRSRLPSPAVAIVPDAGEHRMRSAVPLAPFGGLNLHIPDLPHAYNKMHVRHDHTLFLPSPAGAFQDRLLGLGTTDPQTFSSASQGIDMDTGGIDFSNGTIDPSLLGAPPASAFKLFELERYSISPAPSPPPAASQRSREESFSPVAGPSRLPSKDKIKGKGKAPEPRPYLDDSTESSYASEDDNDVIVLESSDDDEYRPTRATKPRAKAIFPPKSKLKQNAPPRPKPRITFEPKTESRSIFTEEIVSGKRSRKPSARVLAAQSMFHPLLSSLSSLDSDEDDEPVAAAKPVITRVGPPPKSANQMKVGGTFCHHCRKTSLRPKMRCTAIRKDKECGMLYCNNCIYKRYPEIAFDPDVTSFSCPRCLDFCNCTACCKKRGVPYVPAPRGYNVDANIPSTNQVLTPTPSPPPGLKWSASQGAFWGTIYGMQGERVGTGFLGDSSGVVVRGVPPATMSARAGKTRIRVYIGKPQSHWGMRSASNENADVVPAGVRAYVGDGNALRSDSGYMTIAALIAADCSPSPQEFGGEGNISTDSGREAPDGNAPAGVDSSPGASNLGFIIAEALRAAESAQ